jgi:hypothetical protein
MFFDPQRSFLVGSKIKNGQPRSAQTMVELSTGAARHITLPNVQPRIIISPPNPTRELDPRSTKL